jgi:hypothetical protein
MMMLMMLMMLMLMLLMMMMMMNLTAHKVDARLLLTLFGSFSVLVQTLSARGNRRVSRVLALAT